MSNCKILSIFIQDMWLYLSEKEKFNDFGNEEGLVWQETNIPYAVWTPGSTRGVSLKYYPSEVLIVALMIGIVQNKSFQSLISLLCECLIMNWLTTFLNYTS